MGKYNELTRGQTEALVNRLGGMGAVEAILTGAEAATAFPKEVAYLKSLDRCLATSDFFRGWNDYEVEGRQPFSLVVNLLTDAAISFGKKVIKELAGIEDIPGQKFLNLTENALTQLTEFKIRDGGTDYARSGLGSVEILLKDLRDLVKASDGLAMILTASKIRGYMSGIERTNDLSLFEFNETKGTYKRAGK